MHRHRQNFFFFFFFVILALDNICMGNETQTEKSVPLQMETGISAACIFAISSTRSHKSSQIPVFLSL